MTKANKKIRTVKTSDLNGAYIKNMVLENGINKKRHGWQVLGVFTGTDYEPLPVNGIHHRDGDDSLIVHAGGRLYKCNPLLDSQERLFFGEESLFQNQRSQSCMCGDTLFMGGLGRLLGYGKDGLFSVYESALAYVPTTSAAICELHTGQAPVTMEAPSLITRKRINRMRAVKSGRNSHRFMLDGVLDYNSPARLKVSFRVKCSSDTDDEVTSPYIGTDEAGEEVNTVVTIECSVPRVGSGTMHSFVKAYDANGREITVNGVEFRWRILGGRELVLYFHGISPVLDQDNIELEYSNAISLSMELDGADIIAVSSAKDGGEVLLLSCGNNKLYFSQKEDGAFYFPSSNVLPIGNNQPITAVVPMAGGDIVVYKKESAYWLKPKEHTYEIISVSPSKGAENSFSAICLGDDTVAFGKDGVSGIMWQGSRDTGSAQLYERGSGLQALLSTVSENDKKRAFSVVHDGNYYLFIGRSAFVASPRAINGNGSDFEYEWRVFDPCPAICALSLGGCLYMGRENGEVAIFGNDYTDKERLPLFASGGDFVIKNAGHTVITFNNIASVCEGDKISLGNHFVFASSCSCREESGDLQLALPAFFDQNGYALFYEGMKIVLTKSNGELVFQGAIARTDPSQCTVTVDTSELPKNTSLLLFLEKGDTEKYQLTAEGDSYALYEKGTPIRLYSTEIERVFIEHPQEIECVLSTPITDLEHPLKKTLHQIRITFSQDTRGILEVGYDTRKNSFRKMLSIGGSFDLDCLDFNLLAFDPKIKKTAVVKCLERNFDHIRITISSSLGQELGIESITVIYTEKGI